jgi:hypothetical protein
VGVVICLKHSPVDVHAILNNLGNTNFFFAFFFFLKICFLKSSRLVVAILVSKTTASSVLQEFSHYVYI